MVAMATRASNNHIGWSGIGGKGKHKYSGVIALKKLSMNGDRSYTGAAGKIFKSNQITFIDLVSSENYYRRPRIITSIT